VIVVVWVTEGHPAWRITGSPLDETSEAVATLGARSYWK